MTNVTLTIDESTLSLGREYARRRRMSFDRWVRMLIQQTAQPATPPWLDEVFALADRESGTSDGKKWTRDELHQR